MDCDARQVPEENGELIQRYDSLDNRDVVDWRVCVGKVKAESEHVTGGWTAQDGAKVVRTSDLQERNDGARHGGSRR